jgi:hypothetical protein
VARPEDIAPEDDTGFWQATLPLPLALTPTLTPT